MPLDEKELRELLTEKIPDCTHVQVEDQSGGCGQKFSCIIVSKAFDGVKLLDRHRMVNDALGTRMEEIHAFSMKTWTPEQFESKKDSLGS